MYKHTSLVSQTIQDCIELSEKEVKQIQLEIFCFFHDFCKKHNLKYYMAAGTLIGAVRHKGYIPWDDDIDVVMLRKDYDKFLYEIEIQNESPYKAISNELEKKCRYGYTKLFDTRTVFLEDIRRDSKSPIGINIDIFPLEYLGNDYKEAVSLVKRAEKFTWIVDKKNIVLRRKTIGKVILAKLIKIGVVFFSFHWCFRGVRKIATENRLNERSLYVGELMLYAKGEKEILKQEWFHDQIEMQFEGRLFFAPVGYHEYLTRQFNDYMKLPSKDDQVTHHVYKAYMKTSYIK